MKVFIDGRAGTTGLRIESRLQGRKDVELLTLPEDRRHDLEARRQAINACDAAILCLPDAAAVESVGLLEPDNHHTVILDASTAHRTAPGWDYGFPELSASRRAALEQSRRVAVPGCHASGFIVLVYPLVQAGILPKQSLLSCFSVTGYSGGGKKMIGDYEAQTRDPALDSPRQYGLSQTHKHLPEMQKLTGLATAPLFSPVVADFPCGLVVTVPLHAAQLAPGKTVQDIRDAFQAAYHGPIVRYVDVLPEGGFFASSLLAGRDCMEVTVAGNDERILLMSSYDNLGKGASGAALQCMNIVTGCEETAGLVL